VHFANQQFEVNGGSRIAEYRILGIIPDAGIAALFMRGKELHNCDARRETIANQNVADATMPGIHDLFGNRLSSVG